MDKPWLKHYDPGVPATIGEYPDGTLLDFIDEGVRERPGNPALLFKGRTMTYYGRWTYKYEEALRRGARARARNFSGR